MPISFDHKNLNLRSQMKLSIEFWKTRLNLLFKFIFSENESTN
jgi:hypothetical protein